jgi:hypothetical protein
MPCPFRTDQGPPQIRQKHRILSVRSHQKRPANVALKGLDLAYKGGLIDPQYSNCSVQVAVRSR